MERRLRGGEYWEEKGKTGGKSRSCGYHRLNGFRLKLAGGVKLNNFKRGP